MRYIYDADVDALTIELAPGAAIERTVEVDEGRHVDLDAENMVVQVEILWASTGVKVEDLIARFGLEGHRAFLDSIAMQVFKPYVPA